MGLKSLSPLASHIRSLSAGDKAIAYGLGALLLILLLAGAYAIERQFLVEVPSYGGALTEGVVGSPRFVNPLLALSDADRDLVALTYAGLMGYDEHGHLTPILAESYTVSDDGTTYTFILREDASFSDGSPVTSEDVVFTVEKAQDPALKSPEYANWASIRAEAVDARTVRFTLPEPYAPFLADAALGILPARLWRSVSNEQFPFSPLSQEPVGAGPFTASRIERDRTGAITRYELSASEHFALGRPYLDAIRFVYFKDTQSLAKALESGRVESAYGIPRDGVLVAPYSRVFGVFWNTTQGGAFARAEVREALSVALDREGLVRDVLGGYGTPAYGPVPPSSLSEPFIPEVPEDRLAAARAILERGGWEYDESAGAWSHESAGGLSVTLATANVAELKAVAEHIRQDWQQLGVATAIELHEPTEIAADVIRPRQFSALLFGMTVGREDDLFAFWNASERTDPGLNVAQYANRAADLLLEDIREETDPLARMALLDELNETIAADYPAAFTHAPDFLYYVPAELHGVSLSEVASPSDRLAGVYHWYERTERVWPVFAPPEVTHE